MNINLPLGLQIFILRDRRIFSDDRADELGLVRVPPGINRKKTNSHLTKD